jgi:chloramphenicol 3-O-phosphotransferase
VNNLSLPSGSTEAEDHHHSTSTDYGTTSTGRWAGIAAESLGAHHGWTYDLEFDTTHSPDPLDLAQLVLGRLER